MYAHSRIGITIMFVHYELIISFALSIPVYFLI